MQFSNLPALLRLSILLERLVFWEHYSWPRILAAPRRRPCTHEEEKPRCLKRVRAASTLLTLVPSFSLLLRATACVKLLVGIILWHKEDWFTGHSLPQAYSMVREIIICADSDLDVHSDSDPNVFNNLRRHGWVSTHMQELSRVYLAVGGHSGIPRSQSLREYFRVKSRVFPRRLKR
ncbi:hypothetical protein BR93DRAFT_465593 [Coniochaeta sp. PMI_546]|nr:hypothetical protein BR93DRAFT_465593 [Coniochaeta sp. PMI_546]